MYRYATRLYKELWCSKRGMEIKTGLTLIVSNCRKIFVNYFILCLVGNPSLQPLKHPGKLLSCLNHDACFYSQVLEEEKCHLDIKED